MKQEMKVTNKKDVLLLLLYSPGATEAVNEPILGRTRLIKIVFLFWKEALKEFKKGTSITEDNFYKFFPWRFGPFSMEVYDDINFFLLRDFIKTEPQETEALEESVEEWDRWASAVDLESEEEDNKTDEYEEEQIALTPQGVQFAEKLYKSLSDSQRNILKLIKGKLASAPLRAILKYVYTNYPETIERSEIKNEVLND